MRRIGLAVGVVVMLTLAPLAADAQKATKVPRIGTLSAFSAPSQPDWQQRSPFWAVMRELGWIDGQNVLMERRWAEWRRAGQPAPAPLCVLGEGGERS